MLLSAPLKAESTKYHRYNSVGQMQKEMHMWPPNSNPQNRAVSKTKEVCHIYCTEYFPCSL